LWAERISGYEYEEVNYITLDDNNNLYITGEFNSDKIYFNNGFSLKNSRIKNNDSYKDYEGYIAKYNSNGICQWAELISGGSYDEFRKEAVDANKNVFVAGNYKSDSITFNKNIKLHTNNLNQDQERAISDCYIAKYTQNNTSVSEEPIQNNISIYPNPAGDYIEINLERYATLGKCGISGSIQIFNTLGEIVLSVEQTSPSVHRIDISFLTPGIYFIKIGNRVEKFVKM
jgi:hypothetical protein